MKYSNYPLTRDGFFEMLLITFNKGIASLTFNSSNLKSSSVDVSVMDKFGTSEVPVNQKEKEKVKF